MLPISTVDDVFEEYFVTPQTPNLKQLSATYGVTHRAITNTDELVQSVSVLPEIGVQVLEIMGDRRRDTQWLKSLFKSFE